jgi:acetyl esterase/lipase
LDKGNEKIMSKDSTTPFSSQIPIWNPPAPVFPLGGKSKISNWSERRRLKSATNKNPTLNPFLISSNNPAPVCIICPGGGYGGLVPHEGKPVAEWLNSFGISAFVLNYRLNPFHHPIPFLDAQRAVRYVRCHAQQFNILSDKIGMLGFSAGGHLTSTIGTLAQNTWFPQNYFIDDVDKVSPLLNFMVLCYPVISFREEAHFGCIRNLLGNHPDQKLLQLLSTNEQVSVTTPPTFLWTTKTDSGVPCSNTERFGAALLKKNIPYDMHIFNSGEHGLGLATDHPEVRQWSDLCTKWLKSLLNL